MELKISIKCDCGVKKDICLNQYYDSGAENPDLTESIEQNSDGLFYCLVNTPNAIQLVCVSCGKETMVYTR